MIPRTEQGRGSRAHGGATRRDFIKTTSTGLALAPLGSLFAADPKKQDFAEMASRFKKFFDAFWSSKYFAKQGDKPIKNFFLVSDNGKKVYAKAREAIVAELEPGKHEYYLSQVEDFKTNDSVIIFFPSDKNPEQVHYFVKIADGVKTNRLIEGLSHAVMHEVLEKKYGDEISKIFNLKQRKMKVVVNEYHVFYEQFQALRNCKKVLEKVGIDRRDHDSLAAVHAAMRSVGRILRMMEGRGENKKPDHELVPESTPRPKHHVSIQGEQTNVA